MTRKGYPTEEDLRNQRTLTCEIAYHGRLGVLRFLMFYFEFSPSQWAFGNKSFISGRIRIYTMYCLGPFGIQWS
ncbi:hypothetical protein LCGC14_0549110 [marine sediment metagenome]|uniref:Uncharacterized protein n=1 Tax=marine sediment metagenome TaxID=412755 RepID=A0A0F9UYN1_9ZZZZ